MEVIPLKTHREVTIRVVKLDSISTVKRKKQGSRMLDEEEGVFQVNIAQMVEKLYRRKGFLPRVNINNARGRTIRSNSNSSIR